MGKSIYDCWCGGYATRFGILGMMYQRKCKDCGTFANAAFTKREADSNWKSGELRKSEGLGTKVILR